MKSIKFIYLYFWLFISYVKGQSVTVGFSHRDRNVVTISYLHQQNKTIYYGASLGTYSYSIVDSSYNIDGIIQYTKISNYAPLIMLRLGARTHESLFAFAEMNLLITTIGASPIPYIGLGYNKNSNWTFKVSINSIDRKVNYGAEIGYYIRTVRQ